MKLIYYEGLNKTKNMGLTNTREDKIFASVLADGKIHVSVPEGTEGSVIRTYETSDGKTGSKTEMVYTELFGKIKKVGFYEGDYGKQLQITVQDGEEKPVCLSLGTSSNYGEDMMKKLLNVDMEKYVKIVPFSFTDDRGKSKKGVTIYQPNDEGKQDRVENYFYDKDKKKNIHDYPEPKKGKVTKANPEGKLTKDQWKIYFAECREFLVEKITEHFKLDEVSTNDELDEIANSAEKEEAPIKMPKKW